MKTVLSALVLSTALAAPALAIEAIPGSINYNGPSRSTFETAPVGSVFQHQFSSQGNNYREIYVVGADKRAKLVSRTLLSDS